MIKLTQAQIRMLIRMRHELGVLTAHLSHTQRISAGKLQGAGLAFTKDTGTNLQVLVLTEEGFKASARYYTSPSLKEEHPCGTI